jgi:hypothetical protein
VTGYDKHRVGKHAYLFDADHLDGRRCLDPDELRAKGYTQDSRGLWRMPARAGGRLFAPHFEGMRARRAAEAAGVAR